MKVESFVNIIGADFYAGVPDCWMIWESTLLL